MATAIGGVVKGFVDNFVMPVVGLFTGGVDFADKKMILQEADVGTDTVAEVTEIAIKYGEWINSIINLLIVGFVMFLIVKAYNKTKKKAEEAAPAPAGPTQEDLLAEIRDLLKK